MFAVVFLTIFIALRLSMISTMSVVSEPSTSGSISFQQKGVGIRPLYGKRWPNGVVPYLIASDISTTNSALIVQTMRLMENLTSVNGTQCIRFCEKKSPDKIFIRIHNGWGCSAMIGYQENGIRERPVSLMDSIFASCTSPGVIQHELAHVLGFYHEQSRPDRDDYVSIQWNNIESGSSHNFDEYDHLHVDTQGTSYDYGSLMHLL